MKVKDLIIKLKEYNGELEFGKVGHFGEIWEVDESDIYLQEGYLVPEGKFWWQCDGSNKKLVLTIDMPDIGEDPD